MAQAVELRPDLAKLRSDKLFVENHLVRPERTPGRDGRDGEFVAPLSTHGHPGLVHAAQAVDFARPDEFDRFHHLLRRHPIGCSRFVAGAPSRGPPLRANGRHRLGRSTDSAGARRNHRHHERAQKCPRVHHGYASHALLAPSIRGTSAAPHPSSTVAPGSVTSSHTSSLGLTESDTSYHLPEATSTSEGRDGLREHLPCQLLLG